MNLWKWNCLNHSSSVHDCLMKANMSWGNAATLTHSVLDSQSAGTRDFKATGSPWWCLFQAGMIQGVGLDHLISGWRSSLETTVVIFVDISQMDSNSHYTSPRWRGQDNSVWSFAGGTDTSEFANRTPNILTLTAHLFSPLRLMKEQTEIFGVWHGWNNCWCHHIIEYPQPEQN